MNDWLNSNVLFASLFWGSVGLGMFIYGKRQSSFVPLIGGLLMMLLSYLVGDWLWMSLLCGGLVALSWILAKRLG
jgi:hypothetical protein